MKPLRALFLFFVFMPLLAEASNFTTVKLPRGIEILLPKGWWFLGADHNHLLDISAEAALDLSGIGQPEGTDVNLIAANSMPKTTYAAVRVNSTTPVSNSPSEITNLTSTEFQSLQSEMHENFKKSLPLQGNQLLAFFGVRRDTISGHPALVTEYRRSGPKGPVMVVTLQIFTPSQEISINLSYRESEQAIWRPVISKIRQSITVRRWP